MPMRHVTCHCGYPESRMAYYKMQAIPWAVITFVCEKNKKRKDALLMTKIRIRIWGLAIVAIFAIFMALAIGRVFAGSNSTYKIYNSSIARDARILLQPCMTSKYTDAAGNANPYKQRSYKLPSMTGNNYGCAVTAYITGRNILYGENLNPHDYVYDDQNANCKFTGMGSYQAANTGTMAAQLEKGRPVIFRIKTSDNYHFVLVTGIKETAGRGHYYFSDFICIDPVTGEFCYLTEAWGWSDSRTSSAKIRLY